MATFTAMVLKFPKNLLKTELLKNFFIYSFGAIFLKGIAFLLIPLYTRVLSTAEYGQLDILNTITTVLSILLSFGLSQVLFIEYFHLDSEEKKKLVKLLISIACIIGLPLYILSAAILIPLTTHLFTEDPGKPVFILMFLFTFLSYFQAIYFVVLQVTKKALKLTTQKVIIGILTAVINIILVYYLKMGLLGIWLTNTAIIILSVAYAFSDFHRLAGKPWFHFNKSLALKYLKIGSPFIITSLSFWVLSGVDRWLLLYYMGADKVGIYSVASKFASVSEALMFGPLLLVYTPYIFERFAKGDTRQYIGYWLTGSVVVFGVAGLVITFIAEFAIGSNFLEALKYITPLMIGYAFVFLAQLASNKMVFMKRSKVMLINVLLAGICNIAINIILISKYGLIGSVWAFVLSNLVWFILTWIQSSRVQIIPIEKV